MIIGHLKMHKLLACTALLPLCAAAEPQSPDNTTIHETRVDDIVITGTRSASSAFDTPVSITRIDGGDFAQLGAKHQADVLNQVPGAYVQRGS
ncbi:MAG TPA: hypothetical protein VF033_03980, partial [Steroidobacteraceae bacterium]